jgi:hypothetical protein
MSKIKYFLPPTLSKGTLIIIKRFQIQCLGTILLITFLFLSSALQAYAEEVVFRLDFTHQPDGDATQWLEKQGFEFKRNAKKLNPHFENHRLVLETHEAEAGLIVRKLNLADVERIRITWGVDRYPQGADWAEGVFRVPIAAMISFGEEKIDSGAFFIPNAPYFIGLFLGEQEEEGHAYKGKYYHKGGRYFCTPCSPRLGETVITEFNLNQAFKQQFAISPIPPITYFGLQVNTQDTEGGARAFLKTVEFIAG